MGKESQALFGNISQYHTLIAEDWEETSYSDPSYKTLPPLSNTYLPEIGSIFLRSQTGMAQAQSGLIPLFITRKAKTTRDSEQKQCQICHQQPTTLESTLDTHHYILHYKVRLTKIVSTPDALNWHTEFSNRGCGMGVLNVHSYLS